MGHKAVISALVVLYGIFNKLCKIKERYREKIVKNVKMCRKKKTCIWGKCILLTENVKINRIKFRKSVHLIFQVWYNSPMGAEGLYVAGEAGRNSYVSYSLSGLRKDTKILQQEVIT